MRKVMFTSACAALVTTLTMVSGASASEVSGSDMQLGYRVIAPAGFRTYCEQTPSDCASSSSVLPAPRMNVDGEVRGISNSLWGSAFAQVRAERDYPTGSVRSTRWTPTARTDWRLRMRPQTVSALTVAGVPRSPEHASSGPELQIPAPSTPTHITLDNDAKRMLQQVNQTINTRIRPAKDETLDDGKDVWGARIGADGRLYGDCEDYVLAKRHELLARGVPAAALSIAVAHNGGNQTHAVLVVSTDKGDYILDNLSFWVRPWAEAPYQWVMRQNHGDASDWRAIVGVDRVQQTSARLSRSWRY